MPLSCQKRQVPLTVKNKCQLFDYFDEQKQRGNSVSSASTIAESHSSNSVYKYQLTDQMYSYYKTTWHISKSYLGRTLQLKKALSNYHDQSNLCTYHSTILNQFWSILVLPFPKQWVFPCGISCKISSILPTSVVYNGMDFWCSPYDRRSWRIDRDRR